MLLYHSFPRVFAPATWTKADCKLQAVRQRQAAKLILRAIASEGLLLTSEILEIPRNPRAAHSIDHRHAQVRACFTLCNRGDLKSVKSGRNSTSHCDLFGEFAIGLDPIEARDLGAMPTIYFYRDTKAADNAERDDVDAEGGLSFQFFYRLLEIQDLLKVVLRVEADSDWPDRMTVERIREAGLTMNHYPPIQAALEASKTPSHFRDLHQKLFDTDRVPAWNLIDAIRILLDLFQIADSKVRNTPLAYIQQREWRIPMIYRTLSSARSRDDLYPLVERPNSPLRELMRDLECLRSTVAKSARIDLDTCWVRAGHESRPFWSFVREVVVPAGMEKEVSDIVFELSDHHPQIVAV
jgi:hypothetical protein